MGGLLEKLSTHPHVVRRHTLEKVEDPMPYYDELQLYVLCSNWFGWIASRSQYLREFMTSTSREKGKKANSPESKDKIPGFIKSFKVDTDPIERPVETYNTLNEFFTRKLKPGVRPIYKSEDPSSIVQPCDSRVVVFPSVSETKTLWVKGQDFTLEKLMGPTAFASGDWKEAEVVFNRLSPQDYHHIHSPVTGKLCGFEPNLGYASFSVQPYALRSPVDVLTTNERKCVVIQTETVGKVAVVMVGASHVDSIVISIAGASARGGETSSQPVGGGGSGGDDSGGDSSGSGSGSGSRSDPDILGLPVRKGDELAFFSYGGSLVVTVFEQGRVKFDEDLLENTHCGRETLVQYGDSLGVALQ